MTWHIDIERASNGYIIRHPSDADDDIEITTLVAEDDRADSKVEAAVSMLWEVADYFGLLGSKYDAKRLSIGTAPGDYYEDDDTRAESEEPHLHSTSEDGETVKNDTLVALGTVVGPDDYEYVLERAED